MVSTSEQHGIAQGAHQVHVLLRERDDGSATRRFAWRGNQLAAEFDGSDNVLRRYERGPDGYGPLAAIEEDGDRRFPELDPSGNVRRLYDEDGDAIEDNLLTAFGELKDQSGSATDPSQTFLAELGGWRDAATGLVYLRQRWYDPEIGRFISPDPLGPAADVNPYRYAGNNPVTHQDPEGLDYLDRTPADFAVWVVQERRRFWRDRDVHRHALGRVRDGKIYFDKQFGGGHLPYDRVEGLVDDIYNRHPNGIASMPYSARTKFIYRALNELRGGHNITEGVSQGIGRAFGEEWTHVGGVIGGFRLAGEGIRTAGEWAGRSAFEHYNTRAGLVRDIGRELGGPSWMWELAASRYEFYGDWAERVTQGFAGFAAGVVDMPGTVQAGYEGYQAYRGLGLGRTASLNLLLNPTLGLFEAFEGISYGPYDLGEELDWLERTNRGVTSAGMSVLAGMGGAAGGGSRAMQLAGRGAGRAWQGAETGAVRVYLRVYERNAVVRQQIIDSFDASGPRLRLHLRRQWYYRVADNERRAQRGRFASADRPHSRSDFAERFAHSAEWGTPDQLFLVQGRRGFYLEGRVGPQYDPVRGRTLPGGAHQVFRGATSPLLPSRQQLPWRVAFLLERLP